MCALCFSAIVATWKWNLTSLSISNPKTLLAIWVLLAKTIIRIQMDVYKMKYVNKHQVA